MRSTVVPGPRSVPDVGQGRGRAPGVDCPASHRATTDRAWPDATHGDAEAACAGGRPDGPGADLDR